MINYQEEVQKIKAMPTWFKPEAGSYKIKIADEPEEKLKTFKRSDGTDETKRILCFTIQVGDKVYNWDLSPGKTLTSACGQLMLIGAAKGQLKGVELTLIVKGELGKDGKHKNSYTILEALELMNKPKV